MQTLVTHKFTQHVFQEVETINQSLTLMSESLRNDGRIWVPKNIDDAKAVREGRLKPTEIKEENRDYYLEKKISSVWKPGSKRCCVKSS